MQIRKDLKNEFRAFALPAVLVITTGMMILLVSLMTIVELERRSSKARLGSYQADLAVESGLEEAKMILASATASDTFAVGVIPFAAEYDDNEDGSISSDEDAVLDLESGERGRPYLYAIQGSSDGTEPMFRLTPLFATHAGPGSERVSTDGELTLPTDPGLSLQSENNLDNRIALRGAPNVQAPVTAWRTIRDQEGVPISRYSYWVEDMQGYIDAEYVPGNARSGRHARANEVWQDQQIWNSELRNMVSDYTTGGGAIPLWPAPGINPGYVEEVSGFLNADNRLLSEVGVYAIDANQQEVEDGSTLDDTLRTISPNAITPGSLLALKGAQAPIIRVPSGIDRGRIELTGQSGSIEDRWIEENFVTGNRTWEEQALIPFVPGVDPGVMGAPRLNLNQLLKDSGQQGFGGVFAQGENAINQMAEFIDGALPNFANQRQGGFPEDYLRTLAAGAFDYADQDDLPHVKVGTYRGVDSHPHITEFVMTTTWRWTEHLDDSGSADDPLKNESFLRANGNLYILMTVEIFAELWNMTNYPIDGTAEFLFENFYEFPVLGNPGVTFMGDVLENQGGPGQKASFSNHNLVQKNGSYYTPGKQIQMAPNEYQLHRLGAVRYGFYVGDDSDFVPQPIPTLDGDEGLSRYEILWNGVACDRTGGGLERPAITSLRTNSPRTKAVVCGTWGPYGSFYTGMHDVRQSWWAGLNTSFPEGMVSENSYPSNYTPGRRNVRYGTLAGRPTEPYARLLPSEWPDGGHDSNFDVAGFKGLTTSDRSARPDAPDFVAMKLPAEPMYAPMFVSNLGRFVSETELANVYDPVMWKGRQNPGLSTETWPYREFNFSEESEVSNRTTEASHVGGGNTLRIGRPEHEKFNQEPGTRAARLLDLFHCGVPLSTNEARRNGGIRKVEGHINVNTAPRDVLRALAAGELQTDPLIGLETSFDSSRTYAPRRTTLGTAISASDVMASGGNFGDEAGLIADAIIAGRPFVSLSQLAELTYAMDHQNARLRGRAVFGNKFNHVPGQRLQRTDRAAEEVFSRVYNGTTVRSRNYRIHVIGQSLEQTPSGRINVKSTRKKSYRVFVNVEGRNPINGAFDPADVKVETLYETNL